MSLIVTSSTQEQYGGLNSERTLAGIEDPSNYSNHFRSPITLPTGAEIAVESVKIRRGALYDIQDNAVFYQYFGKEQTLKGDAGKNERQSMPIPIKPRRGTYNTTNFASELQDRLNDSYSNPEIFGSHSVDKDNTPAGQFKGFKFATTQRGNASSNPKNRVALMKNSAAVGITPAVTYWQAPRQLTDTPEFTATATATEATITRTAAQALAGVDGLNDMKSSIIGTSLPQGLVEGIFHVNTTGANSGWRIGLSRPQLDFRIDSSTDGAPPLGVINNLLPGQGGIESSRVTSANGIVYLPENQVIDRNQIDYYDYMIESDGTDIKVYQSSFDSTIRKMVMSEVYYLDAKPITAAVFDATYDGVYWVPFGDEMRLLGKLIGKGYAFAVPFVAASVSLVKDRCFAPIGETRAALYPRLNILEEGEELEIIHYGSHYASAEAYRYPTYDKDTFTLTTGDDFYSNNRVGRFGGSGGSLPNTARIIDTKERPYCLSQTIVCDTKSAYSWDTDPGSPLAVTDVQVYSGTLGTAAIPTGIAFNKVMMVGFTRPDGINDYLEGKYATLEDSGAANVARVLGFGTRNILKESSVAGFVSVPVPSVTVTFTSTDVPTFRVHSCFVRVSNLTQNSFNGAKQSTSKIIYHLPRFSNDGREFGDLFLTPGEKTYVKLNNASPILLNQLDVQLVDVNERPVEDLSGDTVVVFHIK